MSETTIQLYGFACFALFLTTKFCSVLQNGLATKVEKSRKQMKERKNRAKKIRGVKKVCSFAPIRLLPP